MIVWNGYVSIEGVSLGVFSDQRLLEVSIKSMFLNRMCEFIDNWQQALDQNQSAASEMVAICRHGLETNIRRAI